MISEKLLTIHSSVEDMFDAIVEANISVSERKMNLLPSLIAEIKGISSPSQIDTDELSTISAKMNAILQIKEQIKTVIMNSGVQITDDLTTYGDRIRAISVLNHFEISGPETYTGKNFLLTTYFNNSRVNATSWTITSGSQYATVNEYGRVDIVEGTQSQQITVSATYNKYGTYSDTITIQVSYDNQLVIQCNDTMSGTSGSCVAMYNNSPVTPVWTITSGSQYATINQNGEVTITATGQVTIQASYSGYTSTKTVNVVYQADTTTETTYNEDGSVTTTTTTTETDQETGSVTTTTTTTTINDNGSINTVESETTTNTDGSSTTNTTVTNEDGSYSQSVTNVEAADSDGSITSNTNTTNYDDDGNVTSSSENTTVSNEDGSSESHTTNYDSEGDPTTGNNLYTDTEGNNLSQDLEYDSEGNSTVTGYDIDTSNNENGEKNFNLEGVDTEFYAFDVTRGFKLNIDFSIDFNNQPAGQNENHHNILTMKRATPEPWYGFQLRHSLTNKYIIIGTQFSTGKNTNTNITGTLISGTTYEYNIDIIYDPLAETNKFVCKNNGVTVFSSNSGFPDLPELRYLSVCIGFAEDENGDPYRYSNINVRNFNIEKLTYEVEEPVISCDGMTVTITCETDNSQIYYRLGQTGQFTLYTEPFGILTDTIVEAYSTYHGTVSETVSETCYYENNMTEPILIFNGQTIEFMCETPGANIYYRLGQTGEFSLYEAPINIFSDTVVEAYSELNGSTSSTITETCVYVEPPLSAPVISCDGMEVTITCSTLNASIFYRLNEEGTYTQYTTPIQLSADTIVEAYSSRRMETSSVVTETCIYSPVHDYHNDYLTFRILTGGTVAWKSIGTGQEKTIEYSLNNGTWTSITASSTPTTISVSAGDVVRLRGNNTTYAKDKSNYSGFEGGTATFNIEGNINSLLYGDNFASNDNLTNSTYQFCSMFKLTNCESAENLILPATSLKNYCYRALFSKATLSVAPALPATTLAQGCYWYLFEECPIERAPELPALALVRECYGYMFIKCTNLNYIKCLAETGHDLYQCKQNWVQNVASSGTFVKSANVTTSTWTTGNNGIPSGWIVYNDVEVVSPEVTYDGFDTITITCETEGATVYYRLNGTGEFLTYSTPITISGDTHIETYSEFNNQTSRTTEQTCLYVSDVPIEASNRDLKEWVYSGNNVTVPYSVNGIDGHSSGYAKGIFNFETSFALREVQPTYLWFQHADQSASIYIDDTLVEKHWGGYTAFTVDVSEYVHTGTNNLKVALKNNEGNYLAPATGDFNFNATLGNVKLLTSPCLPDKSYGYDGFHVTSTVSQSSATVNVMTTVPAGASVVCSITDGTHSFSDTKISDGTEMTFIDTIQNPHLWNGTTDPHLYTITIEISKDGDLYHRFTRPYGLRYYEYVIDNTTAVPGETYTGFLLNGSPYLLRGVCMHDDIEGKANALDDTDYNKTFSVINELGCNFIRLAHYPHPKEVYDRCDQLGIIVQTEGPCVNKLQSTMPTDYYTHLTGQYTDMVSQHYNHPCIMFWGLSNETTTDDKAFGKTKIEEYTTLIKSMDSERLVGYVMSHNYSNPSSYYNNPDVDWFGCNIYTGWYIEKTSNDPTSQLNTRVRNIITNTRKALAFSEYGAGGTQNCHSDDFMNTTTPGNYARHDIEYQMWLHEGHIAAIRNFPQLMFTAEWQLFDIAVSNRNEGYTVCLDGETATTDESLRRLNDKGLVERDHVTKKDTFYIYKAEWNPTPFVHICGKDYTKKIQRSIKCYTNDGNSLSLYVGNNFIETVPVNDHIAVFTATDFSSGDIIRVVGTTTEDTFTFE